MIRLVIYSIAFTLCLSVNADDDLNFPFNDQYSQSTYGGIGLIQTPTARFSKDGEFGFGISSEHPWNRLYSKMQFFPWAETVLRYTQGKYGAYRPGMPQTWKDKGVDVKFKLYENNQNDLTIALGFADLGGTGAYSSEYIVASKAINNLDVSLGLGWGMLAGADHFSNVIADFDNARKQSGGFEVLGGTLNLKRFFSGESLAVFGGVEYFTPIENLSLKFEYDSTDYSDVEGKEKHIYKVGDIFYLDSRFILP